MNAASATSDVERESLASTSLSAVRRPSRQRLPRGPLNGWRWLRGERQPSPKEDSSPGKTTATKRGSTRSQHRARAALIWGQLCYAVLHMIPPVLLNQSTEWPWHHIGTAIESRKWARLRQLVAEDSDEAKMALHGFLADLSRTYGTAVIDANTWLVDRR